MDRLSRILAGASTAVCLSMVVLASGCRSMQSEVPRGKPYSTTGGSPPTVGFNSDPRPNTSIGGGLYGNAPAGTPGAAVPDSSAGMGIGSASPPAQFGTPAPNAAPYGAPTANRYGAPGTASGSAP
jgi:hypothetical protein